VIRDLDRFAATALRREIHLIRAAAVGGRNQALNKAAYYLGQLIAAGALEETTVEVELLAAAAVHYGVGSPPFTEEYARGVIRAGLTAGKQSPRATGGGRAA
jgi:hypothetical protein